MTTVIEVDHLTKRYGSTLALDDGAVLVGGTYFQDLLVLRFDADGSPSPDFAQVAQASRAWARRVEDPAGFTAALDEALAHVTANNGLALIDARVARD